MTGKVDFDKALLDPSLAFGSPSDVASAPDLTREQKVRILRSWEEDARLLMTASEENMGGGEQARLGEVHKALRALGLDVSELERGAGTAKTT